MPITHRTLTLAAASATLLAAQAAQAQARAARITEETRIIQTYPFSEPNPVPILTKDRRLYPYHTFEGYAHESEPREWTVVRMENDLIEVYVLPEVGGKVWGAVVKKTGHEFIYRNEVLKFRNIALRGPWTSGGIEFNFGVIGHTPSTATPVDWVTRENADGSVSCVVGAMDLPSRTVWRVEIRLPADRATFETRALWTNPTPLEQPYYNWMTAAAFAQDDLEVAFPGNAYLQHSGTEMPWPLDDQGRYLPLYRNNTFGGSKSYHVVGELNDFFGGYFQDDDYGFGHWARYEEMPGQKLWLWALSREGGVWEDLLTDTDGQYIEFQAGRLFVQYSPGADINPITQAGFDPLSSSLWSETWFPLEGTGGLTDASPDGAMHVAHENGTLSVRVNAFLDIRDTLEVWVDGQRYATTPVTLTALEPFAATFEVSAGLPYRVRLPALSLDYDSDPTERRLSRPFSTDVMVRPNIPPADLAAFEGRELLKGRRYAEARAQFEAALGRAPWHRDALLGLAELSYRSGRFNRGLGEVNRVLQLDAYDAKANFLAGILYRALGETANARDAFGWAARSMAYRSAANAQLADIMLAAGDLDEATRYARLAIDYDRYSVPAWQTLAIVGRLQGSAGTTLAREARDRLLEIDPLHHFVRAETYLTRSTPASADTLLGGLRSEYPGQTLLELAIAYVNRGLRDDALEILGLGPDQGPVHVAWQAWLSDDANLLADAGPLAFAFPFRTETLAVLDWATQQSDDWRWQYLLALNLWALDRDDEALALLDGLGNAPDFAPLYVARASLAKARNAGDPAADLRRAVALDPGSRVLHVELIRHLQERGAWQDALEASATARARFAGDFNLDLLHVRSLIHVGRAAEATEILADTRVLPSENARDSHRLWEQAHTLVALDALDAGRTDEARRHLRLALEWPESLGQGRPYEPEERLVHFLQGRVEQRAGDADAARAAFEAVIAATPDPQTPGNRLDLLAIASLDALGRTAELRAIAAGAEAGAEAARLARELSRLYTSPERDARDSLLAVAGGGSLFADLEGDMIRRALASGS